MIMGFTNEDEARIRRECRMRHREEGNTECPYEFGSVDSLIWESEATRMMLEELESV